MKRRDTPAAGLGVPQRCRCRAGTPGAATAPRTPGRAGAPRVPLCRPRRRRPGRAPLAEAAFRPALPRGPPDSHLQDAPQAPRRPPRRTQHAARRQGRPLGSRPRARAGAARFCDVTAPPTRREPPPGRGCVLTPHAGAGPRVWCPGVGCRRLSRVELSRRQVSARCRRPGSEWRLRSHREGDGSLGRGRSRRGLVVADPAVTGSEAGWSGTDRGRWAGRGADGRAWQPMARRASPGGRRLAGAGARGGRAGRCAAHHWLWRAGGGPCGGCEERGAAAGVTPKVEEASRGSHSAASSARPDPLADGAPLKRLPALGFGPRMPEHSAGSAPSCAVPALLGRRL